jgi:serine/alanine adding enzyme
VKSLITTFEDINQEQWNSFLETHPQGNIYQSPHMFKAYKDTKLYEPLVICAVSDEGIVCGILSAVIMKQYRGIAGTLSARSIIFGGPLAAGNDPQILNILITEYEKLVSRKAIYTEIREVFCSDHQEILRNSGYKGEERLNILVDLTGDEQKLWNEVHSKRRNEVRRAVKEGVTVKEITSESEIEESYKILLEVYNRAKLPFADKSLFLSCRRHLYPFNKIKYFGGYYEGKLIGTMYTLCVKDRAIDWYAGSRKEYYNKYPNDIIPWEVFKILKKMNYKIFDFGGAGRPGIPYGVRDYKQKFGGEFINLKRYMKVHKPVMMKTGELGLRVWQRLK